MKRKRSDADRRIRQADRLARVLRLLQLIQGHGRWNIPDLATEQECSERTVHRDLQVLQLAGVPWIFDKDARCYRVRADYRFPTLDLTDDELLGQATATILSKAAGLNVTSGATPTTRKLEAVSREQKARLLRDVEKVMAVLDLKLADHSLHQEVIRTVQWALLQGKQLTGQYRSPYQPEAGKLALHPYRLALVKSAWYLIARPANEEQPRTYRIHRFKTLRMVDLPSSVPEGFDLKTYFGNAWAVFRGDRAFDIELEFTPEAANVVTETVWHPTQKVRRKKDGSVSLAFNVDGLNEIAHWVLGWAGRVTVVKPVELRELIVEELRKALQMHQNVAGKE